MTAEFTEGKKHTWLSELFLAVSFYFIGSYFHGADLETTFKMTSRNVFAL